VPMSEVESNTLANIGESFARLFSTPLLLGEGIAAS
jgi:hypothetical protein